MRTPVLAIVISLAAVSGALGAGPHVYTNDDLELLGPPPADPSQPVRGADDMGWEFVQRFIDGEHARLVTERTLAMDERRSALEDEALRKVNERADFVGPYYGDWNTGFPYGSHAIWPGYGAYYPRGSYWGHGSYGMGHGSSVLRPQQHRRQAGNRQDAGRAKPGMARAARLSAR